MAKTDKQLIDECNTLAHKFTTITEWEVPEDYRFYRFIDGPLSNPRARLAWSLAVCACEFLCAHEMSDALQSVLEAEARVEMRRAAKEARRLKKISDAAPPKTEPSPITHRQAIAALKSIGLTSARAKIVLATMKRGELGATTHEQL